MRERQLRIKPDNATRDYVFRRAAWHCEYPEGCYEYRGLTIDHFTPVCLGRLLGWSWAKINHPDNLQVLCPSHHQLKDSITPTILDLSIKQQRGLKLSFGDHPTLQKLFNDHVY